MQFLKSTFFAGDNEFNFIGYHNPKETWNGWAVPCFEKSVIDEIIENLVEGFDEYECKWEGETLSVIDKNYPEETPEKIEPEIIECEGKHIKVYFFKTYDWAWEEEATV